LDRDFARLARVAIGRHDRAMKYLSGRGLPALFAAASLVLPAMAVAAPVPLKPTSPWKVDFGDAHCLALREYGTAKSPLVLAFKPSPIGDVVQMSVVRPGTKADVNQLAGTMTVDSLAPVAVSMLGYRAPSKTSRVAAINLSRSQFQPLRAASTVRLRSPAEIDQTFALSQMGQVGEALDKCIAGLRKDWHIADAAAQIREEARPIKPLTSLFTTADYPSVALRQRASGLVEMMTLIDPSGRVASCMVTGSSGYASLDAQSCSIITSRGRFTPAIGADGKPTHSGAIQRVRWQAR
jgi:TonB family protein